MSELLQSVSTVLDQIEQAAGNGELVVLAGAGISSDPPSCKPIGFELIDLILDGLQAAHPEHMQAVIDNREFYHQMPFEDFCSLGAEGWGIKEQFYHLLSPLGGGRPNYHHFAIASLLTRSQPVRVITTNFDTLIEDALLVGGDQVKVTRSFSEAPGEDEDGAGWLAKIHGSMGPSASSDDPSIVSTTIAHICRDSDLGSMTAWAKYLNGKTVVVLGYSGQDRLDVLSMLDVAHPPSIIWVDHRWGDTVDVANAMDRPATLEIDQILSRHTESRVVKCQTSWFLQQILDRLGLTAVRPDCNKRLPLTLGPAAETAMDKYGLMIAARLLYRNEQYIEAAAALREFTDSCSQADARHFSLAMMGLSDILEVQGGFAQCHEVLQWSDQYYRSVFDPIGRQAVAVKRGLICIKQDNPEAAMYQISRAVAAPMSSFARTEGRERDLAEMHAWVHCAQASVKLRQGDLHGAYDLFGEAVGLSVGCAAVRPEAFATQQLVICIARLLHENADKKITSLRWSQKMLHFTVRLIGLLWGMGRLSSQVYRKTRAYRSVLRMLHHGIAATNPGRVQHYIDGYPHVPMAVIRDDLLAMEENHDPGDDVRDFLNNRIFQDSVVEL